MDGAYFSLKRPFFGGAVWEEANDIPSPAAESGAQRPG